MAPRHSSGDVIEVGRLQVERRAGAHGHALHIPETGGAKPTTAASADAAKFVFRRTLADVRDSALVVPQTSLERLVAKTLRAGQDWTEPSGVL